MTQPHYSPAAERNRQPILEVLRQVLAPTGTALEIASGTGQHVAWFAQHLPQWQWQPTDAQGEMLPSIAAYAAELGLSNVATPLLLDVMAPTWLLDGSARFDAIYCANMLHISAWSTTAALLQGSALHLAPGGQLITYGPYLEGGVPTSTGNDTFDESLRAQNPAWGIRRLEDVQAQAVVFGLLLAQRHAMPANNLLLVWRRAA